MALEVIGGIASIAQLAGTVYTISKTLYEVGEALSNAPSDIKDLARDLETFSDELRLFSNLLNGKDGRYADEIYRLTAKIIGDCATICTKIDRIIRKLRSGSMWAKVKWLYKEKEIMKLLARLRDLKLSLMSTLGVLSALKADHMMNSLGIQNTSLLEGNVDQSLSPETLKEVQETRIKLDSLTVKDRSSLATGHTPASNVSLQLGDSSSIVNSSSTSATYIDSPTSRTNIEANSSSLFISKIVMPNTMQFRNTQALESVDSFHSAKSYQNKDPETSRDSASDKAQGGGARTNADGASMQATTVSSSADRTGEFSSDIRISSQLVSDTAIAPVMGSNSEPASKSLEHIDPQQQSLKIWRDEMATSAMKNFNMEKSDADAWAASLTPPSVTPSKVVLDEESISRQQATIRRHAMMQQQMVQQQMMQQYSMHQQSQLSQTQRQQSPGFFDRSPSSQMSNQQAQMSPFHIQYGGYQTSPFDIQHGSASGTTQVPAFPGHNMAADPYMGIGSGSSHTPPIIGGVDTCVDSSGFLPCSPDFSPQPQPQSDPSFEEFQLMENADDDDDDDDLGAIDFSNSLSGETVPPGHYPHDLQIDHKNFESSYDEAPQELFTNMSASNKKKRISVVVAQQSSTNPEDSSNLRAKKRQRDEKPKTFRNRCQSEESFSTRYATTIPSNDSIGKLWLKALKQLISSGDEVANTLEVTLSSLHISPDVQFRGDPEVDAFWSVESEIETLTEIVCLLPKAHDSVKRILDILKVMKDTLGFKSGIIAWSCFCYAVKTILAHDYGFSDKIRCEVLIHLAEIASIIARYTVMESIYAHWKGMSLEEKYEESLIDLSTHVLRYIGLLIDLSTNPSHSNDMEIYFSRITAADAACRKFSVIIGAENTQGTTRRSIDDNADDSDESENADVEEDHGKNLQQDMMTPPVKRLRL